MTVYYNSREHIEIILSNYGTTYSASFLPCLINTALFAMLWALKERNNWEVHLAEDSENALSIFIGYIMIVFSTIFQNRYFASNELLIRFHKICRRLSIMFIIYGNGSEGEDKYNEGNIAWRVQAKSTLKKYVQESMDILREHERCLKITLGIVSSSASYPNTDADALEQPDQILMNLVRIISKHKDMLAKPMDPLEEISLHEIISELHTTLESLLDFAVTPLSFALVNLVRICVGSWILIIPFIQKRYSIVNLFVVFFLTYAVIGLVSVSIEFGDPFGDDPNDLEIETLKKATLLYVERTMSIKNNPFKKCLRDLIEIEAEVIHDGSREKKVFLKEANAKVQKEVNRQIQAGRNELRLGHYSLARKYFSASIEIASNNAIILAPLFKQIGDIYSVRQFYDDAIECYEESLIVLKNANGSNNYNDILQVIEKVGKIYFDTEQYTKVLDYFQEVCDYMGSLESFNLSWEIQHKVGLIHCRNENLVEAEGYFRAALISIREQEFSNTYEEYKETGNTNSNNQNIATAIYCLGIVHEETCQYASAISCFTEALAYTYRCLDCHSINEMKIEILSSIGRIYRKDGNLYQAYTWQHAAADLKLRTEPEIVGARQLAHEPSNIWYTSKKFISIARNL